MALLTDKVALVTGASRGIGAATAKLLARNGAKVIVNFHKSEQAAQSVVENITRAGGMAWAVQADVTNPKDVTSLVEKSKEKYGDITTLVINAGVTFRPTPLSEMSWEIFESKLVPEMKAAFYITKAILPSMVKKKSGSIIAISSGLSHHAGHGFAAHSASKASLNAFVRALAFEYGPLGIRINTVAPGLTLTDATGQVSDEQKKRVAELTPLKRNGLPEDVAGAVLILASDEARFVTGTYLPVDGGITML